MFMSQLCQLRITYRTRDPLGLEGDKWIKRLSPKMCHFSDIRQLTVAQLATTPDLEILYGSMPLQV